MIVSLGDFISIYKDPEYDFWNNTQFEPELFPEVYKVHQISHNLVRDSYRLALEDITKPGHIDYRELMAFKIKVLPTTKDGSPYSKILES